VGWIVGRKHVEAQLQVLGPQAKHAWDKNKGQLGPGGRDEGKGGEVK
jgi:hypothetical protein